MTTTFPSEFPTKYNRTYVNPDVIALAIADLEPFSDYERKLIVDKMADAQYISFGEKVFKNKLDGNGGVKLLKGEMLNLRNYLTKCIDDKSVEELYFIIEPIEEFVDVDYGETQLVVGTKKDKTKINERVIHLLRHIINENREHLKKREAEDKKQKLKVEKLRKLFDALQDKSMTFEDFQKQSNELLECVKFVKKNG